MRAALLCLLAAGFVHAQGTKKKKPVFEIPEEEARPTERPPDAGELALQRTLQRLKGWPNDRARKAAERLIVQKEKSLTLVRDVLISSDAAHAALKPGAAYVVGRVGDKSDYLTLLLVAAEKPQQRKATTFLEAAWRLHPDAAVAEAFRFFHLGETTLRHQAVRFVLDRVSEKNLPAILELLDRRKSERPFTREIGLRLLDRLVTTDLVAWTEKDGNGNEIGAGAHFYRTLGDESPQVSSRAMRLLASRNDKENIAELNDLITRKVSYWRQRSYAALSLALLSAAFKVQPFKPETLEVLKGRRGLEHPKETLARASAALALAQAALRTNDTELVRLLDREVPIVLIDAVGARRRHYRDFGSVMPLAYAMLRRITGQTIPDHATAWAKWWKDHGRRFRARRELIEVADIDLAATEVEVHQPRAKGGEKVRLTVVSKRRPTFLDGQAFAVPTTDMQELVSLLRRRGFFDKKESDPAELASTATMVVVRVGDLDRKVAFELDEPAASDEILALFDDLARKYTWQLWWDIDQQPSWSLFFVENQQWFREHPDEKARADRLRVMITGALNDILSPEDRLYAVKFAAQLPGGGGALTEEQVAALVRVASTERTANRFLDATVDLLVPAAGEKAAALLIDALADKIGPASRALLTKVCVALPLDQLATLAADPRWKVRRAAVSALAGNEAQEAHALLKLRLEDKELSVRAAAAEALARRRDTAVLSALADLSQSTLPTIRGTAAYSYGVLGGAEARRAIQGLLYDDRNPEVRIRAIDGLADGEDPMAGKLIVNVFTREGDVRVRSVAAQALVAKETPELVDALIETLQLTDALAPERVAIVNVLARFRSDKPVDILRAVLRGDDNLSANAAALGLARRWDDNALVQLIEMIKAGNNERTAIRHLQLLTSHAFDNPDFKRQAENYEHWARTNEAGNPRRWFRDALKERGYDVQPLRAWVAAATLEPVPDAAVPLLLSALRDKDWYVQRNASYLLGLRIGPKAPPVISYSTGEAQAEQTIRAYHDWWAKDG